MKIRVTSFHLALALIFVCQSLSASAQACRQNWQHDDGRLLTIHESFATGTDGRGFQGTVGVQSYFVVKRQPDAKVLSFVAPADIPEDDATSLRQVDRMMLPPARIDQTLGIDEGPLSGPWTGNGCRAG